MAERRTGFSAAGQVGAIAPLATAWAIAALALGAASIQHAVPVEQLFLDPAHLSGTPWYTGLISNLGILCWTAAAVAAAGGAWVAGQTRRPSACRFLRAASIVGTVLLANDLLQLHAVLLPRLLGVSKSMAMLAVVAPAIVWVIRYRHEIVRTRWLALGAAVSCLALSAGVDRVAAPSGTWGLLTEDGAKFLGVVAWAVYFVMTTLDISRSTIRAAMAAQDPIRSVP